MMSVEKMKELNIYQKMHAVMEGVSYVQKENKRVNNQYSFASHDGVTSAVRPHLVENRIITIPQNLKTTQNGNRTEVHFDLRFQNVDDIDDYIDIPTFGYGIDNQDKGVGKALSYGVKYALLKALSLETGDDPERDNVDYAPPIHIEMGEDDVPPQEWITERMNNLEAFLDLQKPTLAKYEARCVKIEEDPIFNKVSDEDKDVYYMLKDNLHNKLKEKLTKKGDA